MNTQKQLRPQLRPGPLGANSPIGLIISVISGIISIRVIYELYEQDSSKLDIAIIATAAGIGIYNAWKYI